MPTSRVALKEPAPEPLGSAAGLRVALFSGNYNYTRDGANQTLNRLVGHLQQRGAEVRVYSPTSPTPAFAPTGDLVSVPSVRIPMRGDYRLALGLPSSVRRDVERFAPTVVHLSAPDLLGSSALRLGRELGAPVVASVHTRFETYLDYYALGWLRPTAERYLRRFYAGCDYVLAPSPPIVRQMAGEGLGQRVRLWTRGVDRTLFRPDRRDLAWRAAQGFGEHELVVAFLGRLVMEKGLAVFADAMEVLSAGGASVRTLVIGDGPARGWLEKRLPDAVFAGFLTGAELSRALASADVLLNPSATETFGNVTLEAMAAGLAVVCADAPNNRALVRDGETGLLRPAADAAAFAEAIAGLDTDRARRARIGRAASEVSAAYSWSQTLESVVDVYWEALRTTRQT